ncbi:MAG: transcriptional repressor [Bacteroidales bacterium]|nr:transcriptional repressor [Bacteroidales bacterium]MCD8394135.1 transcriptional repressor [Bacteroidales bacterium]
MDMRLLAKQKLESRGIRPSVHRLRILEYLLEHNTHPSVDEVFSALVGKIPTLSRTTVYTTLRMLADAGLAQMITIDERHVCYDGHLHDHCHFYCRECGRILDIELPGPQVSTPNPEEIPLVGHIDQVQFYYKGLCAECVKRLSINQK